MSIFLESPWPAAMLCIVIQVVLAMIFMRTGKAWVLAAMAAVLAVTVGAILFEQTYHTEHEQVEDTLHGMAEAIADGDIPLALASVSPQCPQLGQLRSLLERVVIQSAWIGGDLEVRLSPLTSPPSATAYFTGHAEGRDKRGQIPYERFLRKFKVRLHREGDRWLVAEIEDLDPRGRFEP